MGPRSLSAGLASLLLATLACGPRPRAEVAASPAALPDVRTAEGRPPVVLVAREGDPAAAIAFAVTTTDLGWDGTGDDPEPATALAGLVEERLEQHGLDAEVTPSWDGLRATALATTAGDATRIAGVMREAFLGATTAEDLLAARKKLVALGQRPLRDASLLRFARCTGEPFAPAARAGRDYGDVDVARLERWRSAAFGLGRIAVAVTGIRATGEAVAAAVLRGPEWRAGAALATHASGSSVDVVESALDLVPTVHLTLGVGTSSAAVDVAEALGDAHGPLAARLGELDVPFRIREVTGAAHPHGGCVGAVLETAAPQSRATHDLAARVADAVALVNLEASAHFTEAGGTRDGRLLARRAGDARASAERAAWWALVDRSVSTGSSVVLAVPSRRGASEPAPTRDALTTALAAAATTWNHPVVESRSRIEAGQGEAWVLLASPCGTSSETEADSGISALAAATAAGSSRTDGVTIEPWVVSDGVGVVVHGPPLTGESAAAHARRLADIAGRTFAGEPRASTTVGRARADLLQRDARNDGAAMSVLASALAPGHPSWVVPWGASEPIARSADAAVIVRVQALRGGPLRLAVLANSDGTQVEAALRAADRWVPRRTGDTRTCKPASVGAPPVPGTYAAALRSGAMPSAYLAFPFVPGDEAALSTAELLVNALDGEPLRKALGPLVRDSSARVIGWPRSPALTVRVVAPQASLDEAVLQVRALVDGWHRNGVGAPELERATLATAHTGLASMLDPRTRIVATWRGDAKPARHVTAEDVRVFAQKYLGEESMIVVAARPPRPAPLSP